MKKLNIFQYAIATLLIIIAASCRSNQTVSDSYAYNEFGTTLVNISPSGMVTVRSWGSGPNKSKAIIMAEQNAVTDVIFKGFPTSKSYMASALVNEVNARERYAQYFDRFLADGGEYKNFVKEASAKDNSRVKSKSNGRENWSVTVVVDRNSLRKRLVDDGILRQ